MKIVDIDKNTIGIFLDKGTMSSLQAPRDMPSAGVPSNFAHSPMCIFSSAGIQNLGFLDGSGQPPITANLHSTLESSGKPGLAATNGTSLHSDIRSYDQRRCEFSAASMHDHHIKREKVRFMIFCSILDLSIMQWTICCE